MQQPVDESELLPELDDVLDVLDTEEILDEELLDEDDSELAEDSLDEDDRELAEDLLEELPDDELDLLDDDRLEFECELEDDDEPLDSLDDEDFEELELELSATPQHCSKRQSVIEFLNCSTQITVPSGTTLSFHS